MSFSFLTFPRICLLIAIVAVLYFYQQRDKKEVDFSKQIDDLEKQIAALKPEADDDPGDCSRMIRQADQTLADLSAEKTQLREEYERQEASRLKLRAELVKYQQDHPVANKNAD
jgi:acetyl-CoA carboxylase alpha subunit